MTKNSVWVFGYGSIIWDNKDIDPIESIDAQLIGAHRSFNKKSIVTRGTKEFPGLALGLEYGGNCSGKAFLISEKSFIVLKEREGGYDEINTPNRRLKVITLDEKIIKNCTVFFPNPKGKNFLGAATTLEVKAKIILNGKQGSKGNARNYLKELKSFLNKSNIRDEEVESLYELVFESDKAKELSYKILSLDGGGTWAILQVLALQEIFENKYPSKEIRGHDVLKHFDLVIANSGGSMVLAALACNWTFNEIVELFEKEELRTSIFKKLSFKEKYFPINFLHLIGIKKLGSRYSTTTKKSTLAEILKINNVERLDTKLLSQLPRIIGKDSLELIVTTFDIINKRAMLFRSNKNSMARAETLAGMDDFDEINLVEAIHGSSNAPVNYFDFPAIFSPKNSRRRFYLWDGALGGFNNPILAALTEALANGIKRENINILSIGTGGKLVSDEDSDKFRDLYYGALLGKKLIKQKDSNWIDFDKTKHWNTPFGKFKKPKIFFRLFRGGAFFADTISNLSQTILLEPQTWANYAAYINLFSGDMDNPDNNKRFIRISPQIVLSEDSGDLIKELYKLDMDITKQENVKLLRECFNEWKEGNIINEPIQWAKTLQGQYIFAKGHKTFSAAIDDLHWL